MKKIWNVKLLAILSVVLFANQASAETIQMLCKYTWPKDQSFGYQFSVSANTGFLGFGKSIEVQGCVDEMMPKKRRLKFTSSKLETNCWPSISDTPNADHTMGENSFEVNLITGKATRYYGFFSELANNSVPLRYAQCTRVR